MKIKTALSLLVPLLGWAVHVHAQEIVKFNLDEAASLATTIQTDAQIKAEGNGSIKIVSRWPTVISLAEVPDIDVENAALVYKAKLRSENLEGTAFLEMWCHVGGGQYFSRGMNSIISGTSDWTVLQTPFFLKQGENPDKITLNIVINGQGTIWIDDITLTKEPLPNTPPSP